MTRKTNDRRGQITAMLRQHPDGLTKAELKRLSGMPDSSLTSSLPRTPYIYIDRWAPQRISTGSGDGYYFRWMPIYCLAEMPPDAEPPSHKPTQEDYDKANI
jgi:hypothetical protein